MICTSCRVQMDYVESTVRNESGIEIVKSFWQCPECGICVDEADEKFKPPKPITITGFTLDMDESK